MKVFGCKSQYYCSDGIILVAANTLHEAYNLATKDYRLEMYFDPVDKDGNYAPRDKAYEFLSNYFPKSSWKWYNMLEADVDVPQIIDYAFYEG